MSVAHDGSKANDGGNLSKQLRYKLRTSLFVLNCGVVVSKLTLVLLPKIF